MTRFSPVLVFMVLLVLTAPSVVMGQTREDPPPVGQTNLDALWRNVCAGVVDPQTGAPLDNSEFAIRCSDILSTGQPGSGGRFGAATVGNNLGVIGAQGRVRRKKEESLTDIDLHSLNVFATVQSGWMDREASVFENAFDSNVSGALVGLDYLPSETAVAGFTLAYSKVSGDFASGAGSMDSKTVSVTGFESHSFSDRLVYDMYLGAGSIDQETVRGINYILVVDPGGANIQIPVVGTALGKTKGHEFVGGAGLSGDANLGRLLVSPHGRMDFVRRSFNGYTESDDVGMALVFPDQTIVSFSGSIGTELSVPMSKTWGILTPTLNIDYVHEFQDDSRVVRVSFAGDPNSVPIFINTQSPDRDFFNIGASLVALMNTGFALFLDFDFLTGHSYLDDQNLAVGFRAELE